MKACVYVALRSWIPGVHGSGPERWINTAFVGTADWSRGRKWSIGSTDRVSDPSTEYQIHGWSRFFIDVYTQLRVYGVAISIDYRLRFLIELTSCITSSSLLPAFFHPILHTFLCPCCKYRNYKTICLVTWER